MGYFLYTTPDVQLFSSGNPILYFVIRFRYSFYAHTLSLSLPMFFCALTFQIILVLIYHKFKMRRFFKANTNDEQQEVFKEYSKSSIKIEGYP